MLLILLDLSAAFDGQVHNAELAETAEPAEQDSSARLNSALFTGVLGKSP